MIGFNYITNWESGFTPIFTLFIGTLGFISFIGIGSFIMNLLDLRIKSPFNLSSKLIIGIFVFSLINQYLAIFSLINQITIYLFCLVSLIFGLKEIRKIKKINFLALKKDIIPIIFLFFIFSLRIIFCIIPTTKTDELFYHMLLPLRIITDQNLNYYSMPWEGAILPHMHYQFIGTPFYYFGFPDSLNLISFLIFSSFVYTFSIFVKEQTKDKKTSLWFAIVISCGLFSIIDIPTNSSNSILLLCTSIATLIISKPNYFFRNDIKSFSIYFSFLLLGMIGSKLSMIPISFLIYLIFLKNLYLKKGTIETISSLKITLIIFSIFYLPLLIFTYLKSGSPLGPVPSILLEKSPLSSDINFTQLFTYFITKWSPLIWLSWIIFPFSNISKSTKLNLILVFFVQFLIILNLLPTRPRFFGGIQYIAIIFLSIRYGPTLFKKFKKFLTYFMICLSFPLLVLDFYYSYPIIYSAFSNSEKFKTKYIPLYKDFKEIDKIIEKDSQIIFSGIRVNSFHSPRKALMKFSDIKNHEVSTYLITTQQKDPIPSSGYVIVSSLYSNNNANIYCYRTPNKDCKKDQIHLFKLKKIIYE